MPQSCGAGRLEHARAGRSAGLSARGIVARAKQMLWAGFEQAPEFIGLIKRNVIFLRNFHVSTLSRIYLCLTVG